MSEKSYCSACHAPVTVIAGPVRRIVVYAPPALGELERELNDATVRWVLTTLEEDGQIEVNGLGLDVIRAVDALVAARKEATRD